MASEVTNPFSSCYLKPGAGSYLFIPQSSGISIEDFTTLERSNLIDRIFQSPSKRSSIIGPHGTGKSTLMVDLLNDTRIVGQPHGRVQLSTESRNCSELWRKQRSFRSGVLAVDGYEQLNWFSKLRLVTVARFRKQRLLVTAHDDLYGFETVHRTNRSDILESQVVRRLMYRYPTMAEQLLASSAWQNSRDRHGANLRESLFDAYDWFEQNH